MPTGSAFELGPKWNRTRENGWNRSKWVRLGYERSSKKSNWRVSSALLIFSCAPTRQMSPAQLRAAVSNGNDLVETQGLSVPDCYGSTLNHVVETLP